MLVTFTTRAYADITMFGDVAERLLQMMGMSGVVPGAIVAEDVPAALERLELAVAAGTDDDDDVDDDGSEAEGPTETERPVPIARRAWPLIELLKAAAADERSVMWQKAR